MKFFKNFNNTATKQDVDEFVAIDDEVSRVFQEEILEEVNGFFFGEQHAVNEDENIISDESMDVDNTSQR